MRFILCVTWLCVLSTVRQTSVRCSDIETHPHLSLSMMCFVLTKPNILWNLRFSSGLWQKREMHRISRLENHCKIVNLLGQTRQGGAFYHLTTQESNHHHHTHTLSRILASTVSDHVVIDREMKKEKIQNKS